MRRAAPVVENVNVMLIGQSHLARGEHTSFKKHTSVCVCVLLLNTYAYVV